MQPHHEPVLAQRCLDLLAPAFESVERPILVDATLGLGGHSLLFLRAFPQLHIVGLDHDADALAIARERLADYEQRTTLVHTRNDGLAAALEVNGISDVSAVLFDLGVSSMQLDVAARGFAYAQDAPLDMRMDGTQGITAADILNSWDQGDIARILREYSGEKFASKIAREVARRRMTQEFTRSQQLVELLYDVIPAPARRTGGHPAKRTFQALRIAVNDELGSLRRALPQALEAIVIGGRVVVMSYQSGEDAIVKAEFARRTTSTLPSRLPIPASEITLPFRLLTRGAETPSDEEISHNPRAASARLRAIERVAA